MKSSFDSERLQALAEKHKDDYKNATPFPHIAIDDFMDPEILTEALQAFSTPENFQFYKYDNPLEKKLAFDQVSKLPQPIAKILSDLNSPAFLNFLEILTGIDGLIPDPYYRGGGIHQIEKGGKLDVHIDFNWHQKLRLDRRLNLLIYLNKDWEESYGGHFEIWKGHRENSKHILEKCINEFLPIFNRMALFSTSERSYHGHSKPLTCPEGWTRKSIAVYYYTNGRPEDEKVDAHSTTFIKRPDEEEDEKIAQLRELRNKGRLSTNIKSNQTS